MFSLRSLIAALALLLCASWPISSGEKKAGKIAFEVYAKGYFVKNTIKVMDNQALFVLHDKNAFDQIFGFGRVMGAKPKLVDEKHFEGNLMVTVIKSGNTLWKYEVEKVHVDKKQLIVQYTAHGKESTAKFTVPLIVSVPRGDYTEVVFIENGKETGKQAVKK
jgi:hypothetical protein